MNKICPMMTRDITNPIECQMAECPVWVDVYLSSSEFPFIGGYCGLRPPLSTHEMLKMRGVPE